MKTCTMCETPESAVEVSPVESKWKIYLCRGCVRVAVAAWAQAAGPVWVECTRAKLAEQHAGRVFE